MILFFSLATTDVTIEAVIADHLFSLAGDMGDTLNYANFVLDNWPT